MSDDPSNLKNPARNALGAGLSLDKVQAAILKSGYPLQTHVANLLRPLGFDVSPEWSFIDRDSGELRSLDLRATFRLYERGDQTRARPWLQLLVECKQSELPFIFFTGEEMPWNVLVPFIAGQKRDDFTIYSDDSMSSFTTDAQHALSLRSHPFYQTPEKAYTLSKCQRKGQDLMLSGEECYNGLVLPLVKALHHLKASEAPPKTAVYFDVHYAVALAVIDAPMISYKAGAASLTPWVRVLRHEAGSVERGKNDRGSNLAIDFVHRDFLADYVSYHLLPAAQDFGEKALRHAVEIAESEGFVSKLEQRRIVEYEPHLSPRPQIPFLGRKPKPKL